MTVPSPSDRRSRLGELRTAMSLLVGAAADLGVGDRPEVGVLADGRLWLAESDWPDGEATFSPQSLRLLRYMVRTK